MYSRRICDTPAVTGNNLNTTSTDGNVLIWAVTGYTGFNSMPASAGAGTPVQDFTTCAFRCFDDAYFGTQNSPHFGGAEMSLASGTGVYEITLTFRVFVRNNTVTPGTPSIKFMLRTAPNVVTLAPTWTYSNQLCSVHIPEDMVPHGRNAYASGQVTWVCGMTYGGGFQIRGKRDDNATQTDPVYPHNDSTFITVSKVG